MQNEGLNLGDINKLLTKKVEELTLYLIENDKTSKDHQAALNAQQQKISEQELRIKSLEIKLDQLLKGSH